MVFARRFMRRSKTSKGTNGNFKSRVELATSAATNYLSPAYGKSCHHRFGLRRLDGGALHGARAAGTTGLHRYSTGRPADDHEHRGKFPRFSRRRGWLRIDDPDAETSRTFRR